MLRRSFRDPNILASIFKKVILKFIPIIGQISLIIEFFTCILT